MSHVSQTRASAVIGGVTCVGHVWAACSAIAATSLPLLAGTTAVAASQRTTPPIGKQLAELMGSDTVAVDDFGCSVAISGTTAVVGASDHAKAAGRAYVFTKTATGWKQAAELKGSDTVAGDYFGYSVAISGTTAVVGAPDGAPAENGPPCRPGVRVHQDGRRLDAGRRAEGLRHRRRRRLRRLGGHLGHDRRRGCSRATPALPAGRTCSPRRQAGWKQIAELKGSDTVADDDFGGSVAISGTTVVVGASGHGGFAGRAYVFTKTAAGWKQAAELKGSDTVAGDDFGDSVAISGTTVVVGASDHASTAGRAYVFTKTAGGWKQAAELKGSDTIVGDGFGYSVAVSGTTVVVGALTTPMPPAGRTCSPRRRPAGNRSPS